MFEQIEGGPHAVDCENHDTHTICQCGENQSCSTCGWGRGRYPCTCMRERLQVKKNEHIPVKHCKTCSCDHAVAKIDLILDGTPTWYYGPSDKWKSYGFERRVFDYRSSLSPASK